MRAVKASRWSVLAGFGLLTACTQLLWLSYAPITTQAHRAMGVSAGAIGDLAAIFPLVYVVLALPSGRWLDARFPAALSTGAVLTGGGALVRLVSPNSYAWAFAGQCVIAAGQPLVLNAITKIAARHFPPAERTTAVSVGSVALFAGVLAAVLSAGPLWAAGGLPLVVWTQAGLSVVAAAWVLVTARVRPAFAADVSVAPTLDWLRRDRLMWLLGGLLFIGMGEFNAVATWLESILDHVGRGGAAGYLIAILVGAGVVGAAVLPDAVATRDRRRDVLLAATGVSVRRSRPSPSGRTRDSSPSCWASRGSSCSRRCRWCSTGRSCMPVSTAPGRRSGSSCWRATSAGSSSCWSSRSLIDSPYASLLTLSGFALAGVALAIRLPARAEPAAGAGRSAARGVGATREDR